MEYLKKNILKFIGKSELLKNTLRILLASIYFRHFRKIYGKNTQIIFVRGATGDVYVQFLLIDHYLKENNITNYVILGDGAGLHPLNHLFHFSNLHYVTPEILSKIVFYSLFMGEYLKNIIIPFAWSDEYSVNKCRVRMLSPFHFMDTYQYFSFHLGAVTFRKPYFTDVIKTDNFVFHWQKQGVVKDKTVIISPEANSITTIPIWFWNTIIEELKSKGYIVFMNCSYPTWYRAPNIFETYALSVPLLEYSGFFLAVRSGFCDIISSANCKKVILYPEKIKNIDYSNHRCDLDFSSLVTMGLCTESENLIELSTPLLRNITDEDLQLEGYNHYLEELKLLHQNIMKQF